MSAATKKTCLALAIAGFALNAQAFDWSKTYVGYRWGSEFAEPFNNHDIAKSIFNLNHVDGYRYGTNFLNVDLLLSNDKDPANVGAHHGAQELYMTYRHTLDFAKVFDTPLKFGPIRSLGLTAGFDINTKEDAGYNSRKRLLVAGPTMMLDVPGFLNISLLQMWESNAPYNGFTGNHVDRYYYTPHPMLNLAWGIPLQLGRHRLAFEGFGNFIADKGKNEFGADTKPELNIDMQLMYDVSPFVNQAKDTIRVGLEYQYWRNKFGNDHTGPSGQGAFAKTPMIRAEYRF